jgi:gamma-glutamyltranspeptidase
MAAVDAFAGVKQPRSPVYGRHGMVVSGHSLASLAGLRTLEAGGSVADAIIATSAALCVALPQATSLGGDAFIIYHDAKSGTTDGLNASGHAPAGATTDFFRDGMVVHGPLAASVPGIVRGWEELHKKRGRLPWASLFETAIDLAENGHPLSRVLAKAIVLYKDAVAKDEGCSALYMPGGKALVAGDIIRQPALAKSLRMIAEQGSGAYYEGPIAESIGAHSQKNDGLLSAADFRNYQPEWVQPIKTSYRGLEVNVMPPNSYGILMLLQLNALSGLDSSAFNGDAADRLAYLLAAARAAFAEGQHYICDPRVHPAPLDELLGGQTTGKLQALVREAAPGAQARPGIGGTSCITLMDESGDACTVVQSVFHVFGSAFLDPGTGILLNNRMTGFDTDPDHRNAVAPGKRPSHTLNPVMVFDKGKVRFLMSTPGGAAQTISNVQILTNMVDRGMELTAAIEAPRWAITQSGDALLDDEVPDAVMAELQRRGHKVSRSSGASYFGSAKCIEVLPNGVMCGAADIRREAFAVGR